MPLSTHLTPQTRVRVHTHRSAPFSSRLHCTNPSLSCSGGATPTGFPLAPLQALATPLLCRPVPDTGHRDRLSESPGHLLPLAARSWPRVPGFQVSVTAISLLPRCLRDSLSLVPGLPVLHGPADALSKSLPFSSRFCSEELSCRRRGWSARLVPPVSSAGLYSHPGRPQPVAAQHTGPPHLHDDTYFFQ